MADDERVDGATRTDPARDGGPAAVPGAPDRPARRGVTGVVALLALVAIAAALAGPWDPTFRETAEEQVSQPLPSAQPTATPDPLAQALNDLDVQPWDLRWLGIGLLTLAVAGAVALMVRLLLRLRPPPLPEAPDGAGIVPGDVLAGPGVLPHLRTLREGVEDAGAHLRSRRRAADAVIAAWVSLEDAAARSGVVRHPAATPTEFTVNVLDRTQVDPAATRTLLGLYLRARFGEETMTPDDVATAMSAVRTLAAGLGADSGGPGGEA